MSRRAVFALLWLVLLLGAAELGARAYWATRGVPFLKPDRLLYAWYPVIERVERARPRRPDPVFDVLLLGGSVLDANWGYVPHELRQGLRAGGVEPRLFNLAVYANTSRDSRIKYGALQGARFDLVIVYHGINEARANNVPPELFRADYSHYQWYEMVDAMAPHHGRTHWGLPHALRFAALRVGQRLHPERYVGMHRPHEEWLDYGGNLRSAASLAENLTEIARLAAERGDPLLLMSFAFLPPGTPPPVVAQTGWKGVSFEMWGRTEHVVAALEEHNRVVRRVAEARGTLFVDQARLMPADALYFDDVCHLNEAGSRRFVTNLMPALRPLLESGASD